MDYSSQFKELEYLFELKKINRHQPTTNKIQYIDVSVYEQQDVLDKEKKKIFGNIPLLAGHINQLDAVGSYILSDWDEFPYIIIKGEDHKIRAFMNVCRHRGSKIQFEQTSECLKALICPYHGWSYKLDGTLKGITQSYSFPNINKADYNLKEIWLQIHEGLIWVSPNPNLEFDIKSYLGEFYEDLAFFNVKDLSLYKKSKIVKKANWKLLIKTYLEGYHVPYLHKNTLSKSFKNGVISYKQHNDNIRLIAARANIMDALLYLESPAYEKNLNILDFASIYYILFPNTFFIFHPDYVSINYFYPVKPDVTIWTHEMYYDKSKFSPDESIRENQLNKRFIFTNDVVFDNEDFLIAEKVQCGIKAEIDAYHTIGKDEGLVYFFQTSIDKYVKG